MSVNFRVANNALTALIVVINAYVIAAPLLPQASFWVSQKYGGGQQAVAAQIVDRVAQAPQLTVTGPNKLIIPAMLLDQPIVEGPISQTYANLKKGIWRWPSGSSPDKGGNTVLLGHRFTYDQPKGSLYFMHKLAIGDTIALNWQGKQHIYEVSEIKTVPPDQTDILKPTADSRLTIYTCTPLWKPVDRLVVVAKEVL